MTNAHPPEDRLIAMVLDELAGDERDAIEAHVGDCDACREIVLGLRRVLDGYRAAPESDAPASVLVELLEAQAAESGTATHDQSPARHLEGAHVVTGRTGLRQWLVSPLPAAALLVLLLAGAFWIGRSTAPVDQHTASTPPSSVHGLTVELGDLPELPQIPFQVVAVFDST
jgi:anti-sigma factor RsiW